MAARRIALICALAATPLAAQEPDASGVTVMGRVLHAESNDAAPYSTVDIVEAHVRRFTDADGRFTISPVPPGTYHLRVRQLGFAPFDTVVAVTSTSPPLELRIRAVPRTLASVQVTAPGSCSRAQIDSVSDPTLAAILAAVRENAERELLLRSAYPFVFGMESTQAFEQGGRRTRPDVDTLHFRSDAFQPYRRGGIVFVDTTISGHVRRRMRLPTTVDFADPTFLESHCLVYSGVERGAYQIAFTPLESIFTPDVEGKIELDSATFVIRSALVRLTRPWKIDPTLTAVESHTTYAEILPTVVVVRDVRTTQTSNDGPLPRIGTEMQRLVSLLFTGRVPEGLTASPKVR